MGYVARDPVPWINISFPLRLTIRPVAEKMTNGVLIPWTGVQIHGWGGGGEICILSGEGNKRVSG